MKVLLAYKKSVFELYGQSPDDEVRAFLASGHESVQWLERSHEVQAEARRRVEETLRRFDYDVDVVYRGDVTAVRGYDLVVTVGGDGTFLDVARGVLDTPMLGVNSDPTTSVGFFCAATALDVAALLARLDAAPRSRVGRLRVAVNGESLPQPVLNDVLLAHANAAAVTRLRLESDGQVQSLKSSGLLVATAAGSTGWIYQEGGEPMPLDDARIQYHVRGVRGEPFRYTERLAVRSLTRQAQLFLDGAHFVHPVTLGSVVTFEPGPPVTVIGDIASKRAEWCDAQP